MLYEVITIKTLHPDQTIALFVLLRQLRAGIGSALDWQQYVITSYSIHYTKLYESG